MGKYYVSWKAFVLITDDWGRETPFCFSHWHRALVSLGAFFLGLTCSLFLTCIMGPLRLGSFIKERG